MLVRDFVQPLPLRRADRAVSEVLPWLCRGTPVAIRAGERWRYIRPVDALGLPATRQLCDVPSRVLETVDIDHEIDWALLSSSDFIGATRDQVLVGGVDCANVLAHAAQVSGADEATELGVAARERLIPKFLHDLSNALSVATMAGRTRATDEEARGASLHAVEHAATLVRQMRSLYVTEPPRPSVFEAHLVVEQLVPMLRVAAAPASFSFQLSTHATIQGEPWRLERALLNLVLNASEAAASGRIHVELSARDQHEYPICISVDDDGPGFSAMPTAKTGLRGHGINTVRRQVALLGGVVEIERSPLGGARVLVALAPPRP